MKTNNMNKIVFFFSGFLFGLNSFAQITQNDIVKIDYNKIFAYCLDGNITSALTILEHYDSQKLSSKDLKFKTEFENRFKYAEDKSDFLADRKSPINELLKIYRDYWRSSLLDNSKSYDSLLMRDLSAFLSSMYKLHTDNKAILQEDTIDVYLKKYISSFKFHTTGFGKTGKYSDLLVWKSEKDTVYRFSIFDEQVNTPVIFMDDFITIGWEEYASLGLFYPGGWTTKEALYCVRKAYDLKSEDFLIDYLCHEGRHFMDYKLFPKLTSADLEYRAKLTELSLLKETLFEIINNFIDNANYESDNGHSVADYCVIRDLSKVLFKVEFEKDISKWKKLSIEKINKSAYDLLKANTKALKKQGARVEKYIKK
jgi:hypothetical protein